MSMLIYEYAQLDDLNSLAEDIRREADKNNQSIVEESEQDEYLNEFSEKYIDLFSEEKYEEIIEELLALREKFFFEKTSLQIIICCIFFAGKIQNNEKIIKKLIKIITESDKESINSQLNMIGILFKNFSQNVKIQQEIFQSFIEFLKAQKKTSYLQKTAQNIDDILQSWAANNKQKRNIYNTLIELFQDKPLQQDLRLELIIKFIQSFGNKDTLTQDELKLVQNYLVILLSQNNIKLIPSSILYSQAFSQLKSSKLPIATIVEYFITGNLEQYLSFESSNKSEIEKLGLDINQISQFVRIKAIPQIVESGTVIQFKELAQKLKVQEQQVEEWIILAIQYNLIEAQIDQFNASVNIISNDNKYFSQQDWQQLNQQLLSTIQKLKKQIK